MSNEELEILMKKYPMPEHQKYFEAKRLNHVTYKTLWKNSSILIAVFIAVIILSNYIKYLDEVQEKYEGTAWFEIITVILISAIVFGFIKCGKKQRKLNDVYQKAKQKFQDIERRKWYRHIELKEVLMKEG